MEAGNRQDEGVPWDANKCPDVTPDATPETEHFDRRSERGLLGCLIKDAAEVVPELVKDFPAGLMYVPEHAVLLTAILDCYGNLQDVDGKLTVAILIDYLKRNHLLDDAGGENYVLDEVDIEPSAVNWRYYKDKILLLHQERQLRGVLSIASGNGVPIGDRIAKLVDAASKITINNTKSPLEIVCFATLQVKPISYLWRNKLARGLLNLIAGDGGVGKGQLFSYISAMITKGGEWPDDAGVAPIGDVLIISDEDDPETVLLPRLIANDAILSKVHIMRGFDRKKETYFSLSRDMSRLYDTIEAHPDIILIVLDPINEYIGVKNQSVEAEVRAVLTPLERLAEENNIALIGITHFNKKEGDSFITRFMNSGAFIHSARTAWGIVKDKDNPDMKCFMPVKDNILKDPMSMKFWLKDRSMNYPVGDQYCEVVFDPTPFKGMIDEYGKRQKKEKTDGCMAWLEDKLHDGPVESGALFEAALDHGYTRNLCFAAKDKSNNIFAKKLKGFGAVGGFEWVVRQ